MLIKELRILPPLAVGRLGSSPNPVAAYDLVVPPNKPVGFRQIQPAATFEIDPHTHQINVTHPTSIIFKDAASTTAKDGTIRPVAPFLELFAITDEHPDKLVPVTTALLQQAGLGIGDIQWDIVVANYKVFRRTNDENDKIVASQSITNNFEVHPLLGESEHFLKNRKLPLGTVQLIAPSEAYPGLRLRFTPAGGKVYGSSLTRKTSDTTEEDDPIINNDDLIKYDAGKGSWLGYKEKSSFDATYTMPAQIFAGYSDKDGNQVSWGYLDDECDGIVIAGIAKTAHDAHPIFAAAHIVAGPPAFAPDILPVRAVSDELEQILKGTDIDGEVPIEEAEEIVRRAFESITLMNTAVMNGNPINGRENIASTMVRQDTNDFGRLYEPIMAGSIVDNLALRSLHERVFNGLSTGAAAWFADALRRPDKIGNLSDTERRKMPGLMRGADGRGLTLTYRMINTVIKAAASAMFRNESLPPILPEDPLVAGNLTAQLHYRGAGNPYSVLPRAAISNCFPGLEYDFRNLWRRTFKGIVLSENDNYVLDGGDHPELTGHRLVAINGYPTMVRGEGPVFPGGDNTHLTTADNPSGAAFMEWSNLIAGRQLKPGDEVHAYFTKEKAPLPVLVMADDLTKSPDNFLIVPLIVNSFFIPGRAELSPDVIKPGELTHGLCAPWQNDYRECACYYWAASRPDYVNVTPAPNGSSQGDMWLSKRRTGQYVPDNRVDSRLVSYDDLFRNWEGELNFIIDGRDALGSHTDPLNPTVL
ncbi:hypothetical protein [Chitinophaga nivalis]|uniref:Uncharacterized protein n=1 Tax=Chitinophaga nivalis TaxID=2991709 RepID=A0ABT3IKQ3_9BACT|nr:hypothetical protein [Chitinophaga nivalis]MCW3465801.1 hypothetical protein [Chitinophaga nivalis]MCW3484508.1 hypothetical protein [Chitinophaga nivalis]